MKTWGRAPRPVRCGYCGARVLKGDPVLELRLEGTRTKNGHAIGTIKVKRVLYRCSLPECAGEAVPVDLPVLVERTLALPVVVNPGALPKDFKALQAGEREAGEEG